MKKPINFKIEKRLADRLGRVGRLETLHGVIDTPAFVVVGTKATVKALSPEQVKDLGTQVVLANTYHLYLQPGEKTVEEVGGLGKFMNWSGPSMTDSGGFQVFSLGEGFEKGLGKFLPEEIHDHNQLEKIPAVYSRDLAESHGKLALVDEEGVTFTSHLDGSMHRFIPERAIEIQHALGADMIFAFDECTSPTAPYEYQKEAMDRTHRWAERCLKHHKKNSQKAGEQGLFGVLQGGRYEDLRKESARVLAEMGSKSPLGGFDGFGIGGSFSKEDLDEALIWVNEILPEDKPRHLLGIGEPEDLFLGVEHGVDLFDCVAPTRIARNGTLYTKNGKINITNTKFSNDYSSIENDCECYVCLPRHGGVNYTKSYINHLFKSREMFGATLASIHNLYFIVNLVKNIRKSILEDNFFEFRDEFLRGYKKIDQ